MTTNAQVEIVRANWVKASADLSFKLITPYFLEIGGRKREAFALLPEYGAPNGVLICLTSPPNYNTDSELANWAEENDFYCSFLNVSEFQHYDSKRISEALDDWTSLTEIC